MADLRARWEGKIGFMQGRLSPLVGGRIQAFPWDSWRAEFPAAAALSFRLMEWTLDQDRLYENPLLTERGQAEIRELSGRHGLRVGSLTGDCFMQAPFWKAAGATAEGLKRDFDAIAQACHAVGIAFIVVPLVDNGRLDGTAQEDALVSFLLDRRELLRTQGLKVVFESDFPPLELAGLMSRLAEATTFGVNYDIGNSAALGYDPIEEIAAYGTRILNVHVKDRVLGGTTVPLGTGNAQFSRVFEALAKAGYRGDYILQTARAADCDHAGILAKYRDMTADWLNASITSA